MAMKFPVPQHGLKRKSRQSGATLIEVLVAILIFSFGLLGLIGLQSRAMQFSGSSEDRNRAAALAAEAAAQLYTLRGAPMPTAQKSAWLAKVQSPANGGLPNVQVPATDITTLPSVGGMPVYEIAIVWQAPNSPISNYTTQVVGTPPTVSPELP